MSVLDFAAVASAILFASVVQAATGFGLAILAVPVLFVLLGTTAVVQLVAPISLLVSLLLAPALRSAVSGRMLLNLAAGSCIGFPIGLGAFLAGGLVELKLAAGFAVVAFALVLLINEGRGYRNAPPRGERPLPLAELGVGAVSGAMSAALAMPGPAVIIYLMIRRVPKQTARAVALTLFGLSYGVVTAMHAAWGGMSAATWWLVVSLAPVVLVGTGIGHVMVQRVPEGRFRLVVLAILLLSGLTAILMSLWAIS